MGLGRRVALGSLAALASLASLAGSARAEPAVPFSSLAGWAQDDHAAAFAAFLRSCARPAGDLARPCREGSRLADRSAAGARRFFERWFEPQVVSDRGFLTGYFEPELDGSLVPDETHRVALLARPPGLVVRQARSATPPGWPSGMTAARQTASGWEKLPDRAAIEAGALGDAARAVVFLADPVDAFMVHVQGSARIRLPDGSTIRVGFDGRNGYPYTAIARLVAEQEGVPPASMTADRLVAWLKDHRTRAPAIMAANRSFIFFRRLPSGDRATGPVGAAGVPLTAGRSLAVDRAQWPYGTPVWLAGDMPGPDGAVTAFARLVIAQDTGAAIVGRARGDLFLGSGAAAGAQAALLRHPVRWIVLRPRRSPAP